MVSSCRSVCCLACLLVLTSLLAPSLTVVHAAGLERRDELWSELSLVAREIEAAHDGVLFALGAQGSAATAMTPARRMATVAEGAAVVRDVEARLRRLDFSTLGHRELGELALRPVVSLQNFYAHLLDRGLTDDGAFASRELGERLRSLLVEYGDFLRAFHNEFPDRVGDYHPRSERLVVGGDPAYRRRYLRALESLERGDFAGAYREFTILSEAEVAPGARHNAMLKLADMLLHEDLRRSLGVDRETAWRRGFANLRAIVELDDYSPVLLGAYLRWRALHQVSQVEDGSGLAADIPHRTYNRQRARLLRVIRRRLQVEPGDYMARQQFYALGELPNPRRLPERETNSAVVDYFFFYGEGQPASVSTGEGLGEPVPEATAEGEAAAGLMAAEMRRWERELATWDDPEQREKLATAILDLALIQRLHENMARVGATPPEPGGEDADYHVPEAEDRLRRTRQLGRMVHNFIESRSLAELGDYREYLYLLRELLVVNVLHLPYAIDNDASRDLFWWTIHRGLSERLEQAYGELLEREGETREDAED